MADRVHPRDTESPPVSGEHMKGNSGRNGGGMHRPTLSQDSLMSKDSYAYSGPPSGTYVIQVPKDQIYKVPPPENAHKYKLYTAQRKNRGTCRRCCCATLGLLILLIALLAAGVGIFYLLYHPKAPSFSVEKVSVQGINITSDTESISPVFNVTIRAENPNGKIGFYYETGSSVTVQYNDVTLCEGPLAVFYQPPKNTTLFSTELSGGDIVLSSTDKDKLAAQQKKENVPLKMTVELPVKVRIGSLKTWKLTGKANCAVALSGLTAKAKVVSKDCSVSVRMW